jgi:hypothetical protein
MDFMEEKMRNPRASVIFSLPLLGGLLLSPQPAAGAVHFRQEARLTPSDAAEATFGSEVALSSDATVALVGASGADCSAGEDCGAAYVFVRSGGRWIQQARLTAADAAANAKLGIAVALSGDGSTALLRARSTDCIDSADCAVAHVFRHLGDSWVETATLKTSGPFPTDLFSASSIRSMALSGDGQTALLGAPTNCPETGPCGLVHVYVRNGESWSEETRLTVSDGVSGFGESVDLSKDGLIALVGVTDGPEELTPDAYRLVGGYVFVRSGGTWVQKQRLAVAANNFLTAPVVPFREVTLSGDGSTALLSSLNGGCGHQLEDGVGYCGVLESFVRTGESWTEAQYLGILNTFGFGLRAALSGDGTVAMTVGLGAVVFERRGDSWVEEQRSLFGHAMSLSADGRTALTGAGGAAYIYTAAAVPVPTLGGVGLAALTLALVLSALVLLRRRRAL